MKLCRATACLCLLAVGLVGCSSGTTISTIKFSDPECGVSVDVPVDDNGNFKYNMVNEQASCDVSGTIRDEGDKHAVRLVYVRQTQSNPNSKRTDKLDLTFQTASNVEVPVGLSPGKLHPTPADKEEPLAKVTVELKKGE
jgi:hypothetical protein